MYFYILSDINHLSLSYFNTFLPQKFKPTPRFNEYDNPILLNSYLEDTTYFRFLRNSTITSFFATIMIDLPLSFQKSKSLFSKNFKIPSLRFLNISMRHGRRTTLLHALTKAWNLLTVESYLKPHFRTFFNLWFILHHTTKHTLFSSPNKITYFTLANIEYVKSKDFFFKGFYHFYNSWTFRTLVFGALKKYNPLFTFFIKKTDKTRLKNTRGKVDKLKVIWRYNPPFKRFYQSIRWFLKDLRFQKSKSLSLRLVTLIKSLIFTPDLTFLSKVMTFVHNFVFQNYRFTLLKTLKATT